MKLERKILLGFAAGIAVGFALASRRIRVAAT